MPDRREPLSLSLSLPQLLCTAGTLSSLSLFTLGFSTETNVGLRSSDDAAKELQNFVHDERRRGGGELWCGLACRPPPRRRSRSGQSGADTPIRAEHSKSSQTAARSLAQVQSSAYTRRRHEKKVERKRGREEGRKEGRKERKREVRRKERFVVAPQSAQIGSGGGGDGGDDCGGGGGRQDVRIITNGEKRVRVTEQLRTAACE